MPDLENLRKPLAELSLNIEAMERARRGVNDPDITAKVTEFLEGAFAITRWHERAVGLSIADDMSSVLEGLRALSIPSEAQEIGRTPGLSELRASKGQAIVALLEVLEAAEVNGLRPRNTPFGILRVSSIESQNSSGFDALLNRLTKLESSLDELDAQKDAGGKFVQQFDLIALVFGSLKSEARLARMLLQVSDNKVPVGALMRTLEIMAERASNLWATIDAWREQISDKIRAIAGQIRVRMRRVVSGAKISIGWSARKYLKSSLLKTEPESVAPTVRTKESINHPARSQVVAEHLPLLRRYARALVGAQSEGDAYVTAMLGAIAADTSIISYSSKESARVSLFKLFSAIVREVGSETPDEEARARGADLLALSLSARQVFLLLSLERFSEWEVAEVLDMEIAQVRKQMTVAGTILARNFATRVLICEPDEKVYREIVSIVTSIGHEALPQAATEFEAIDMARQFRPGVIIFETQLAGGNSGLNAVNAILREMEASVICVTAYPERFLRGEKPESAFLLSKPFQASMLAAVITQALLFQRKGRPRS